MACQRWGSSELQAYQSFVADRYGSFADFKDYKVFLGKMDSTLSIVNYMYVVADSIMSGLFDNKSKKHIRTVVTKISHCCSDYISYIQS